jgi:hypothetical protein
MIGQNQRMTIYDEEMEIMGLRDDLEQIPIDNDRVQMGITCQVQGNGEEY